MGKTKNLDQLLKELNEMQMQFDNLKDEMVTKDNKRKKNQIKTELASDKIDNDFFKTLTTAPKIDNHAVSNKQLDNQKKIESNTDDLLFSLDIEHEDINKKEENLIDNFEDSKEIIESKTIEKKSTKNEDLLNKEENINTNIQNIKSKKEIDIIKEQKNIDNKVSEKSFLSIKQKLDKIKKEIADREIEINKEQRTVKKGTQNTTNQNLLTKKVLASTKKKPIEKKVISNSKSTVNTKTPKPTKVIPKTKKRDTVDVLTIIILVLLIVLIITAWALLK